MLYTRYTLGDVIKLCLVGGNLIEMTLCLCLLNSIQQEKSKKLDGNFMFNFGLNLNVYENK